MFSICQSGKNKKTFEYTEVNGIICQFLCPAPAGTFIKENFIRKWSNASQWPDSVVPPAGANVTVNGNWTVLLDIDPNPADYLVIDGTVFADDTRDINITANSILIRAGNITAGSSSTPFLHKFTVQINGQKTDSGFVVSPSFASTKFFAVTGSLNLHGIIPGTARTYLTAPAFVGATTLSVDSSTDWAVGDTLVISPSFNVYNEYETVTITAINADGTIGITPALKHIHFGSSSLTINNAFGTIDTRAQVGHLNRNIQIVPGPDAGWGFTTVVHGFLDGNITRVGSVNLHGVQFLNGGQLDSLNSPLVFLNTINGNYTSTVSGSTFVNCKANCITLNFANNVTITNNVLFNAWVFGVQASDMKSFSFTNNLIIGVEGKPTIAAGGELVACFATLHYINPVTDRVTIKNNYCSGSQAHGFAVPHTKCTELETNPTANNTVGSAAIGFIINTIGSEQCQGYSYAKAFACRIGQISGAPGISSIQFTKFIMVDNQRGITLKHGNG